MREQPTRSDGYWRGLERHVTSKVDAAMLGTEEAREWFIPNLRGLERMARKEGGESQTIQMIMSGRRLLGDRSAVSLTDDPFARVLSAVP